MAKKFNTEGICYLDIHYAADTTTISSYIIHTLIDKGEYFAINRARQYGKTTLMNNLYHELQEKYLVFFISFEELGSRVYASETEFCNAFLNLVKDALIFENLDGLSADIQNEIKATSVQNSYDFQMLSSLISRMCLTASKKVILMIDEVDSASNNQIFLDFLGMLRNKYLQKRRKPTFQSVILAGVYDIKNLKQKIRTDEAHKYNSPWNIAADFDVDMSLGISQIEGMLKEYETDYHTGMDAKEISSLLYEYTAGYPYLVSRICKIIDEKIAGSKDFPDKTSAWTVDGLLEAVKILLQEPNPLFDDIIKKLADYTELKEMLQNILFTGTVYPYNRYDANINLGTMFGFLTEEHQTVQIANRIFETFLYNVFLSEELTSTSIYKAGSMEKNRFIAGGMLQMDLVMEKFKEHFTEIYGDSDEKFLEENGRRIFLMFMKPIINGVGNYYIEARTRDQRRTDVIIDYKGVQNIVELKIWHGNEYNHRGEEQLFEYLEYYHKKKGYLLSFNFNKNKTPQIQRIAYKGKEIVEVVV